MKYNVHLYPVFKVLVEDIVAPDSIEAINMATSFDSNWQHLPMHFVEEFHNFLVDIAGDEEHVHSIWYMGDGETECLPVNEYQLIGLLRKFLALYEENPIRGSVWANFHQRVKQWLGVKDEERKYRPTN